MFVQFRTLAAAGAIAAACLAATAADAGAGWIIGLVDGKSIVTIDPATRKVTSKADISGAGAILGIDVRPADGTLYGLAADGNIVSIDVKSGQGDDEKQAQRILEAGCHHDLRLQSGRRPAAPDEFGRREPAHQRG